VKKLVLAATTAAFFIPGAVAAQEEQPAPQPEPQAQAQQAPQQAVVKPLRNNCGRLFTQKTFLKYAQKVYWRTRVTKRAGKRMKQMVRCQHSPKAERKMRMVRRMLKAERTKRLRIARMARSLTPYNCGSNGWWAIPCSIIACESGFSWSAYNPSGASGPYQLLGWGAPMPADTPAKKLRHHQIAARLWNGGAGRSHWVC
jgi:hypothetical protein